MPELPDLTVYVERTAAKVVGQVLRALRLPSVFVLRTALPPVDALVGQSVAEVRRLGKRLVLRFESGAAPPLYLAIHLMIAGRLHWLAPRRKPPRHMLAALEFDGGTLALTEAGSRRRASLHVLQGEHALDEIDAHGLEPLACTAGQFAQVLTAENHTLKRALTDPRVLAGIGNAYSDEILHRARLSPLALTRSLDGHELHRLHAATQSVLRDWTERLRAEAGDFPQKVTAFHAAMAVHGRHGLPCPVCSAPIQRIVYASNETNYCARCQTGGRILADRALSRLLKASFPRDIDELG